MLPLKEYAGANRVAVGFLEYSGGGFDLLLDNIRVLDAGTDSVDAIIPETDGEEVEYYSLQGIRVINPKSGDIPIRRCGGKSTKRVFR